MPELNLNSSKDPRYPIGEFLWPESLSRHERERAVTEIAALPARMRAAVSGLTEAQLDTPYREGGWTIRQVVHHVPDSHLNSYVRYKLALTEDEPTIKPYDESAWAKFEDSRATPIETSLRLLETLHERWVNLMRGMTEAQWKRRFLHPEHGPMALDLTAAMYAWHGAHHLAHITNARAAGGW